MNTLHTLQIAATAALFVNLLCVLINLRGIRRLHCAQEQAEEARDGYLRIAQQYQDAIRNVPSARIVIESPQHHGKN